MRFTIRTYIWKGAFIHEYGKRNGGSCFKSAGREKSIDVKVIDISEVSVLADYFIIASGSNSNQVQAMVDNVDEQLSKAGYEPKQIEGTKSSN